MSRPRRPDRLRGNPLFDDAREEPPPKAKRKRPRQDDDEPPRKPKRRKGYRDEDDGSGFQLPLSVELLFLLGVVAVVLIAVLVGQTVPNARKTLGFFCLMVGGGAMLWRWVLVAIDANMHATVGGMMARPNSPGRPGIGLVGMAAFLFLWPIYSVFCAITQIDRYWRLLVLEISGITLWAVYWFRAP